MEGFTANQSRCRPVGHAAKRQPRSRFGIRRNVAANSATVTDLDELQTNTDLVSQKMNFDAGAKVRLIYSKSNIQLGSEPCCSLKSRWCWVVNYTASSS